MVGIFECVGAFVTICLLLFTGYVALICIIGALKHWKSKYKVKHRFDNPPVAKCYCRDCKYWDCRTWHCGKYEGYAMAAAWFCCLADPLNATELKKRDMEEEEYIKRLKKLSNQ